MEFRVLGKKNTGMLWKKFKKYTDVNIESVKKEIELLKKRLAIVEEATEEAPAYVKKSALEVINKVKTLQNDNTITFLAMSDAHQDDTNVNITNGNKHAGMAAKLIADYLTLDFCAYLGDYTWSSSTNTADDIKNHIEEVNSYIDRAFSGKPQFRTSGNHDGGAYSNASIGSTYLYSVIGSYNDGAIYGSKTEGYCYRDFQEKKLRVICLNTAEGGVKEAISNTQLIWFAQSLRDTPSGYGIIILSHHPLDWGAVCQASNVVYQYSKKGSVSFGGSTVSFSSASGNALCAIHGHTHCYKYGKLNYISNSRGTEYDVYRVATPNMCYARNNEYGQNGSTEYYGIEFGETQTYSKTADSATDTAFVVNVIDTEKRVIHSICYGAGYDRTISYGNELIITKQPQDFNIPEGTSVTETIEASGDGVTYAWEYSSDGGSTWQSFSELGLDATQPTFTIAGNFVTTEFSGWKIRCIVSDKYGNSLISNVATMTVTSVPKVTNLVPTALDLATASGVFNGVGYRDGAYLSTAAPYYNTDTSRVTTGLIPYTKDTQKPIYIKGVAYGTASHDRVGYRSSAHASSGIYSTCSFGTGWVAKCFDIEQLGDKYFKLTPKDANTIGATLPSMTYIAFSCVGKGADLIITIDEPIG